MCVVYKVCYAVMIGVLSVNPSDCCDDLLLELKMARMGGLERSVLSKQGAVVSIKFGVA